VKNLLRFLLASVLVVLGGTSCKDDPTSRVFELAVPCAASDAGACTWGAGTCDFSGLDLDFCPARSAPPSCYTGPEEAIQAVVFEVPAQLGQGLTMRCDLVDNDAAAIPANATVCIYPLAADTCLGTFNFSSDAWDEDREMRLRFNASGGAKVVVVDPDGSLCDSLTVSCEVF
jgi:hypothetical protein